MVVLSMNIDAVVDGGMERYKRLLHTIRVFRQMARLVDQRQTHYQLLNAGYKYDADYGLKLKTDVKAAHAASLRDSPTVPGREDQPIGAKHGGLGSQRQFWQAMCADVAEAGGPRFGSHIWDEMKQSLNSARRAKQRDYGGASRDYLVTQGEFEALRLDRYSMPIMRYPDSGRIFAELVKDDRGIVMRICPGHKRRPEDWFDLVLHGQTSDGRYSMNIAGDDFRSYALKQFLRGTWNWMYVLVSDVERKNRNGKRVTRIRVNISYVRPARPGPKSVHGGRGMPIVDPERACEVVWDVVPGERLRKCPWRDNGTDDGKVFHMHLFAPESRAGTAWGKHIAVDGAVDLMRYNQERKKHLELVRDGRRRVARRLVRPVRETLRGLARKRARQEKNFNNCWARDVVFFAQRARCGVIRLYNVPDGATQGLLLDGSIPWGWYHLVLRIKQLAAEKGIKVEEVEDVDISSILAYGLEPEEQEAACAE